MTMKKLSVLVLIGLMLSTAHATTYRYFGPNFDEAFGSYTINNRVTGTFTTAEPLADNLSSTDISGLLQSYEFTDGIQTLNESNSAIIQFFISTDRLGNPNTWGITVWGTPITTIPNGPVFGIDTNYTPVSEGFDGFIQESGFSDGSCFENNGPGGQCSSSASQRTNSGNFFVLNPDAPAGNWIGGRLQVIPTLGIYGMVTLMTLMLLAMMVIKKRKFL